MKGVAIIGCGAIGTLLAEAIDRREIEAKLIYLYDIDESKAVELASKLKQKPKVARNINEILEDKEVDIVVEAASQKAVKEYLKPVLDSGKEILVMSVGALLDLNLKRLYKKHRDRIHVPSGAIAGLDALKAIRLVGVKKIILITRKPVKALKYSQYLASKKIEKPTLIYEGPAEEAVKLFPRSVNVAAALALYSDAPVLVKIIADPNLRNNIHEIHIESEVSEIKIVVKNMPHPQNPRTSYLAALSAVALLKELCKKQ
ncbi:MAG: aspartate dehydrogenase [Thermoprotei archaeon]|nr:MAG: aspartate dehydrogenase [Thermoprotei archaeon]